MKYSHERMFFGIRSAWYVAKLFEAYRYEREHPHHVVQTERYREWIAKRDADSHARKWRAF